VSDNEQWIFAIIGILVLEILNQWKNVLTRKFSVSVEKKFTDLRHINKLKTDSGKVERNIVKFSVQDVNWMECCYLCGKKIN